MDSLLEEIIKKTSTLPQDQQIKQICDQIQKEEEENSDEKLFEEKPTGPNIFLSILIPGITGKEICFICLEREFPGKYITSMWSKIYDIDIKNKRSIKRTNVWEIKETDPKKILEFYAKILKFMKGE